MKRPRRRGLAAINSEVRDGIVPAADQLGLVASEPGEAKAAGAPHYRTVAVIIACAFLMEQMDATILATALPTMARDFGVPVTDLSTSLTSYLLALAIFIPASGRMADRFGSKTVFRAAIVVFLLGSILCSLATNLPLLVAARFLQGAGGAMMNPVGRLILLRSVDKRDMVAAMSWLIMPALIGPILGPPVGGFIVTYLDWRWIFYLNIPIGLLGLVLVTRYIGQIRSDKPPPVDLVGFVLSGLALGALLFGLETVSRPGELLQGLGLIGLGAAASGLYIAHARRRAHPILDLTLLQIPTFRLSLIGGSLLRITQGAQPFLLPLLFQVGFGMTAAQSGSITIAGAFGSLAMKSLAPRVLRRVGFRRGLTINGLIAAGAYAVCALLRPDWPITAIFALLVACGFFMSFQFTAYNSIAYDEIPPERMSAATSFYSTFQQLMLSIGICMGAAGLHLGMAINGRTEPALPDFSLAFVLVTAISAVAVIWNRKFSPTAGHEMAGR